ncbi:hypothetical protein HON59_00750 [bacterium]|jgi:hypothetical protein|nr:hypothetical protein [bacterium]MBT4894580.1 hypothetical protein [bacterium]
MTNHSVSNFGKEIGLIHEVMITGGKIGVDKDFWIKLAHDEKFFSEVVKVYKEIKEIKPKENVIDCDVAPFMPKAGTWEERFWKLGSHVNNGIFKVEKRDDELYLNNRKVELHVSKEWREENLGTKEHELEKELDGKFVLNVNVLDHLLKNPSLIPESWKQYERGIIFLGTLYNYYRFVDDYPSISTAEMTPNVFVRLLVWEDNKGWVWYWIGSDHNTLNWYEGQPILFLGS